MGPGCVKKLQIVADHFRSSQFIADHCSSLQTIADDSRLMQMTAENCRLLQTIADFYYCIADNRVLLLFDDLLLIMDFLLKFKPSQNTGIYLTVFY